MKKKVANMVRIMGIGLNELVIDLPTSVATFNSIEWVKSENKLYLHIFHDDEEIQISFDFDDLSKDDKLEVFVILSSILYN
jgi:hypothetical protein